MRLLLHKIYNRIIIRVHHTTSNTYSARLTIFARYLHYTHTYFITSCDHETLYGTSREYGYIVTNAQHITDVCLLQHEHATIFLHSTLY